MALSVPADRHWGLHGGQVVSDPALHGGPLRPGVGPHRRRRFFLAAGGDRAGQTDQAADLGHRRPGAFQVRIAGSVCVCVSVLVCSYSVAAFSNQPTISVFHFHESTAISDQGEFK